MRRLNKEYGTGRTGQSRRLFWQIFLPDLVPADAETVASLDDLLGKLVQIFSAKIGVAEVAVEIGHREHHPVAVFRAVGQVVGNQGGQDIGRHFLRADRSAAPPWSTLWPVSPPSTPPGLCLLSAPRAAPPTCGPLISPRFDANGNFPISTRHPHAPLSHPLRILRL